MNQYDELKQECEELCTAIRNVLPGAARGDIENYVAACAIAVWSSHPYYTEEYRAAIEAITGEKSTAEQVVTALGCCEGGARLPKIPDFFRKRVEADKSDGDIHSRKTVDALNRLLVALAFVNGDFTMEEATTLGRITAGLTACCDQHGIAAYASAFDASSKITPCVRDAQQDKALIPNSSEPTSNRNADKPQRDSSEDDKPEPVTITLNVSLSTDDATAVKQTETAPVSKPEEPQSEESLQELLAELDSLVGLTGVKQDVHSLLNFIKVCKLRKERSLKVPVMSYHLVFTGNPGTGKTTVARLVAKLYYHMGILPQGQLVETDRSALVAGYLGQTAIKTQKVIQSALGGVLFIDEAYSLANDEQDSYGKEAIETLLKAMEDHRDELVVIVAGYDELMHKFIDSNPGLRSRFSKYFNFPDYEGKELAAIFSRFCETNGYMLEPDAVCGLKAYCEKLYAERKVHFGNARDVRNLFEQAINLQANRLAGLHTVSDAALTQLTKEDLAAAFGEV